VSPGYTLAIANAFASVGAGVAICGRTESRLVAAAEQLREHGTRVRTAVAACRVCAGSPDRR
jgi:short-subunit dehydrogenase